VFSVQVIEIKALKMIRGTFWCRECFQEAGRCKDPLYCTITTQVCAGVGVWGYLCMFVPILCCVCVCLCVSAYANVFDCANMGTCRRAHVKCVYVVYKRWAGGW
jgi:hypothetical protein